MRYIFAILTLTLSTFNFYGQSLSGNFCTSDPDYTYCLSFYDKASFSLNYRTRLGAIAGSGEFRFHDDTLELNFLDDENIINAHADVQYSPALSTDSIEIIIDIKDGNREPATFVNIAIWSYRSHANIVT